MIKGIGVDITSIPRIERAVNRHGEKFLDRVFTCREKTYCGEKARQAVHLAGKFAAKEAVKKAAGVSLPWRSIEILNDKRGKPFVRLSPPAGTEETISLSISHSDEHAVAFVTVEEA